MTVHLVRHASAGSRNELDPHDADRHLDQRGRRQAEAVADALVDAGVVLILSSGAARCVETVAPLAERLGLEVGTADELFEGSDPEAAWEFLAQCADDDGDVVLCSHGDVIPDLIRRAQLRGMEIPGRSGCSKGSRWTLTGWDGERFARGDYEPNPA